MPNVFLTSDTHFGHVNICKFTNYDGSPVRPWDAVEEMDEEMVKRWNDTVGPNDKVYHLGDVVINRKSLQILNRLNGDKVLIKGNHDIFKMSDYTKYFRDVRAYHVIDRILFSHIPVHTDSIGRFRANIHGHLHEKLVQLPCGKPDPRYFCVSVEQWKFSPVNYQVLLDKLSKS